MCHLQTRDTSELKQNCRLYRESSRKVHGSAKGMRSPCRGKGERGPRAGKAEERSMPLLFPGCSLCNSCSCVAGEAGNRFCCFSDPCCKSHSSSLRKSCLTAVFVRLVFVPFSGLEEVPKEVQEGRIVKNNFKETRIEPRKSGACFDYCTVSPLAGRTLSLSADSFQRKEERCTRSGIESRSGGKEQCVLGLLSLFMAWIMCFHRPVGSS